MRGQLSTGRWQKLRAAVLAEASHRGDPCHLCGDPIDYALPGTAAMGPTVDHLISRAFGCDPYDPTNLRPAHLRCNSRRGARLGNRLRSPDQPSRAW